MLLFLAFFLAFAIKVPLFPLHTWLPDAHVEAPTAGSVMLASVMLKMGTYGLLRFCLPMFPNAARENARRGSSALAIIGIIYGALVAMVQPNMKKLVAYSSVSHLGFVVLGIVLVQPARARWRGVPDAEPRHLDRRALHAGRLSVRAPPFARDRGLRRGRDAGAVALDGVPGHDLASIGLPTLNNFVGEFLVLQGAAIGELQVGRLRRDRRDPLRLLHALDVSADLLRRASEATDGHGIARCPRS